MNTSDQKQIAKLEAQVMQLTNDKYRLQRELDKSARQKHALHESLKIAVQAGDAALAGEDMHQLFDFEGWLESARKALTASSNAHPDLVAKRPHYPSPDKLWFVYCPEDGCDEDGMYWDGDWECICNYKLLRIEESKE